MASQSKAALPARTGGERGMHFYLNFCTALWDLCYIQPNQSLGGNRGQAQGVIEEYLIAEQAGLEKLVRDGEAPQGRQQRGADTEPRPEGAEGGGGS